MGFGAWAKLERRRKDCLRECLGLGQQGQGQGARVKKGRAIGKVYNLAKLNKTLEKLEALKLESNHRFPLHTHATKPPGCFLRCVDMSIMSIMSIMR